METKNLQKRGFSLIELLVVLMLSSVVLGVTVGVYGLFRTSVSFDESKAALAQNARVALDRMTREIRQSSEIVTEIPDSLSDTSVAQPGEILFEDGHTDDLTYKRYYVQDGKLYVSVQEYYFSYDPSTRVAWNASGTSGQSPIKGTISTNKIAERVENMELYGSKPLTILLKTTDSNLQSYTLRTAIFEQNL